MKARHAWYVPGMPGIIIAAWLLAPSPMLAQAPPGPQSAPPPAQGGPPPPPIQKVTPAKPRQTIMGAWKLNKDESDNPRDRARQDSGQNGGQPGGYGGRRGGGGYPGGGGRGGYGGRGESDEDRQRMADMLDPPREIKLSMTGAEVDLLDNLDRKRAFMTDGRKLQKSKDTSYEEIAAHWDGTRLVSDEKDSRGNKLSRTFELSSDGLQLFEKVHVSSGRNGGTTRSFEFVYDATDNPSNASLR